MPVINPQGEIVARFRKLFPFRPYERDVAGGTEFCVFDVPGAGRFGVSICYDMWFPETTRTLAAMGAEVILHPTMTDTIDRDVELAIARASAAQNQVYFFDINGVGDGGVGRSIVCDPSGYVLHQADGGAEIVPISVDFERVRRERELGLRNLGQPLKSFRDRDCDFKVYRRESGLSVSEYVGTADQARLRSALATKKQGDKHADPHQERHVAEPLPQRLGNARRRLDQPGRRPEPPGHPAAGRSGTRAPPGARAQDR